MVQKVTAKREFEAELRHATTGKLCLSRIRQRKERGGLRLSSAVSNMSGVWSAFFSRFILQLGAPVF